MIIATSSSPHTHRAGASNANRVMLDVLLALIPGLIVLTWFFGWGNLVNLIWCVSLAVSLEALIMWLRKRPVIFYISDLSAVVTAALLALAIPPYTPWWASLIGIVFAIGIAKHLYGGLGFNPFNPAMVGYVVLLLSFPVQMTQWPVPANLLAEGQTTPGLLQAIGLIFGSAPRDLLDGITAATPLDLVKQNSSLLLEQLYSQNALFDQARLAGAGFEWVNLAFLAGGLWLLYRKAFTWHAPVGMLATLTILSLLFYDNGSSTSAGSPLLHLLSGATMLGAFFIITDPVSGATSRRGRLVFGIGVGLLVFVIRAWGSYPDAMAFAVMLMNFAAPTIDYYTQPRTYGHKKANKMNIGESDNE